MGASTEKNSNNNLFLGQINFSLLSLNLRMLFLSYIGNVVKYGYVFTLNSIRCLNNRAFMRVVENES